MNISDILRHKGADVVTMSAQATTRDLLQSLADHNIGAVVISDGTDVKGIASERDIVRRLNERGAALLDEPLANLMTESLYTCAPTDSVDKIAETMTERRIRHMPVMQGKQLVGIVSIGDVVKSRMTQLEIDRGQLESYITQGR